MNKIHISTGNSKMGAIPSVSLPAVITCLPGCPCAKTCYAAKLERIYKTVKNSYVENFEIYKNDPGNYFSQIDAACHMFRFFRWHVSGDIVNSLYFQNMVRIALSNPHCTFLAFTKRFDIVNKAVENGITIPKNLQIVFSAWDATFTVNNPYNFPVAHVIFKGETPCENWKICGGNCTECASCGIGCWELKRANISHFISTKN